MAIISESNPGLAETGDSAFNAPTGNLSALLYQTAKKYRDHEAVISLHQWELPGHAEEKAEIERPLNQRLTYRELHLASVRLAGALSSKGVNRGSSVVTVLFNQIEWCLAFWATMHLGCRFVPLDPRTIAQTEEALYLLRQANADVLLVASDSMAAQVDAVLQKQHKQDILRCVTSEVSTGQLPKGWVRMTDAMESSLDRPDVHPALEVSSQDTAVILFSSGTTSRPEACPLTSVNLSAPAVQLGQVFQMAPGHSICQHLPSFHIFGITFSLAAWLAGATVVFPSPSFDAAESIRAIQQGEIVHAPCVPIMVQAIAEHPSTPPTGFTTLQSITLGGAPSFPRIIEICKGLTPKRLCVGYGLTEGVVTLMNLKDIDDWELNSKDISSGRACSGSKIKICKPGERVPIECGQLGELHQGGLPVFKGYLNIEGEACYQECGMNWVATGDQAYMDEEGYVYIFGRYKDIIIRGGENISPAKIENCLRKAEGVSAYVIGIPDELAGEVPIAVVQQTGTAILSGKELKAMAISELTPGFTPTLVLDVRRDLNQHTFPTTTTGKVQKSVLREWVIRYLESMEKLGTDDGPPQQTLESQVASIWAHCSGQKPSDIDYDASIHTIADSMVLIQLTSQIRKRLQRNISMTDLVKMNTVTKISNLLADMPLVTDLLTRSKVNRYHDTLAFNNVHPHAQHKEMQLTNDQVTRHLETLGFGWNDVEDMIPVSDCMKLMTKGGRNNSWNHRHSLVVRSSSTSQLIAVLRMWIERNPMLRTTHITSNEDLQLYIVMRPSDRWLDHQIAIGSTLATSQEIPNYRLNDSAYDHVKLSGPLFKCTVLPINDSNTTGLVLHMHHVMFDGMVMHRWYQDLNQLLRGNHLPSTLYSFHEFASLYQTYRTSSEAQQAVDFHVRRLRGLGLMRQNFWPQQRAPRWFKGDDQCWFHENGSPSEPGERVPLDGDHSCGAMGFIYKIHLPFIRALKSNWELSPPIVAKAACALFNIYKTGAEEAVFVSDESGRSWPSTADNSTGIPPNASPLDIGGPTFQKMINRVRIQPGETTLKFLKRMQEEQRDIDRYCHAPLDAICRALEQDSVAGAADVAAVRDILQRQLFDWLSSSPSNEDVSGEAGPSAEMLEVLSRSDLGLVWFPTLLPSDNLLLEVSWDDAQLKASEVCLAVEEFLCAMVWISSPVNLERPVAECEFNGNKIWTEGKKSLHR